MRTEFMPCPNPGRNSSLWAGNGLRSDSRPPFQEGPFRWRSGQAPEALRIWSLCTDALSQYRRSASLHAGLAIPAVIRRVNSWEVWSVLSPLG